ncbi:MAG: outer membrane beta-barrel protein [Bacteroidota bacterium]
MHFFEKEYKKRFKGKTSTSGVDVDQLWSKIEEELKPKSIEKRPIALLLSLLALGMVLLLYVFSPFFNDEVVATENSVAKKNTIAIDNDNIENKEKALNSNTTSNSKIKPNNSKITGQTHEIGHQTYDSGTGTSSQNEIVDNNYNISQSKNSSISEISAEYGEEIDSDNTISISSSKTGSAARLLWNNLENRLFNPIAFPEIETVTADDLLKTESNQSSFNIGLFAGTNLWFESANNSSGQNNYRKTLDKSLSATPNITASILASISLRKNIYLTTGLTYQKNEQVFEYTRLWDTVMFRDNDPNGDLINAMAERRVRQHNTLNSMTLPVLIGLRHSNNRISIGIDGGVGFNLITRQEGKSLTEEDFIFEFSDDQNAPYSSFHLSYHLQPNIGYHLSKNLSLQLRTNLSLHPIGQLDIYDHRRRAFNTAINLGIVWQN